MKSSFVLEVQDLQVVANSGAVLLDRIRLALPAGQITAVLGETGSGKTTLINSVLGLLPSGLAITSGTIRLQGTETLELHAISAASRRAVLGIQIGYVPQDVRSGLNPLMSAWATVREAARRLPGACDPRVAQAFRRAGLDDDFIHESARRRPGALSGGQCQRVLIAQAIVNCPRLLLLDEPTAALDPLARQEVVRTLRGLATDDCSVCLVTHDLATVAPVADRVAVMYLGQVVEEGPAQAVLAEPRHPYTQALLRCVPRLDTDQVLESIPGEAPASLDSITGCRFHPRCPQRIESCSTQEPRLVSIDQQRTVACHLVQSLGN